MSEKLWMEISEDLLAVKNFYSTYFLTAVKCSRVNRTPIRLRGMWPSGIKTLFSVMSVD